MIIEIFKDIDLIRTKKDIGGVFENNRLKNWMEKSKKLEYIHLYIIIVYLTIINFMIIKHIFDLPNVLEEYRINQTKQLYKEAEERLINRSILEENTEYIAEDENLNNEESLENSEVTNIMSEYNLDDFDIEIFEEMKKMEKINDAYNDYLDLEN